MNGPRVFLQLTRIPAGPAADAPGAWHDAADVVGVDQFDGWTRVTYRDGSYDRVDESAVTVLKMMGATVVTAALTEPPGGAT